MLFTGERAAAEELGVTRELLRDWMRKADFPTPKRKGGAFVFDMTAVRAWRDAQGRKGADPNSQGARIKQAQEVEKLKQLTIKTEGDRTRLDRLQKELLPRQSAELVISTMLTEIGDDLDQICLSLPKTSGVPVAYQTALANRLKEMTDDFRDRTVTRLNAALKALSDTANDRKQ